ncbi:MAG: DUF2927 domain-containing protein [Albidovulum sp.]|nr:DUF2927 domain-containing protein [Albidovulum sp.]
MNFFERTFTAQIRNRARDLWAKAAGTTPRFGLFEKSNLGSAVALLGAASLLAGCAGTGTTTAQHLDARPAISNSSSTESELLTEYYAAVEKRLVAKGYLRTDGGYSEAPLAVDDLVANFERQAFYDEHAFRNGRFVPAQVKSVLKKWNKPVRIEIVFGDSVSPQQQALDKENITEFAVRLGDLTGLDIELSDSEPNYYVLILNKTEQLNFVGQLQVLLPDISERVARDYLTSEARQFCSAITLYDRRKGEIQNAVVLIKAEHPPLMKLACIHEEMSQALGLVNDSKMARPSIFNDDEEFALLTVHDELMLKILYDSRLERGMTADDARPIVKSLASELGASLNSERI